MIGNNPQIIPSFKLFTNPACVTALNVLFLKVVSIKTLFSFSGFTALEIASLCTNDECL
jgi:hypothetical protein